MARIRATHVPAGSRATGGQQATVRYAVSPIWPPVTTGHDAFCMCTWVWRAGAMRMKYANAMCPNTGHAKAAGRG